jgi:glycosyltransferase involved in cell wall biosynthesis
MRSEHSRQEPMTVLVVMPLAEQRGGAELSLRHLAKHGRGQGVRWVVVFLQDGPMVGDLRNLGVTVEVASAGRLRQPHRSLAAIARIVAIARRERAEVIVGWMTKGHIYGGPAAKLAGRPAIWYQHGNPGLRGRFERVANILPARGVITVSRANGRAQAMLRPVRPQRTVYPGAELDRFDVRRLAAPGELRARLGLPVAGPLVGIVGRLQRWKGVHVLIDALALLHASHPQAHCVVVGGAHEHEPAYADELARQVAALGLGSHVTFAGFQRDVARWMQAMDVVVHASDREPFGIVVVEAMALGKPVIAGSQGGPREIVRDGVDGLLVPYGDAAALATTLRRYLDDPAFARRLGVAARQRATEFSARRYAENVISAVHALAV